MTIPLPLKRLLVFLRQSISGMHDRPQQHAADPVELDTRLHELYTCLSHDIDEIAEIFYGKCIVAATESLPRITVVNSEISGKAALATRAFQLLFIVPQLGKYLSDDDASALLERLLARTTEQRDTIHCHDLYQCYLNMGGSMRKKHIYYFSVDIAKYILGYESNGFPSAFPCLSSYISSGIPRDILTRSDITQAALVIQSLVPNIKVATDLAIAYCFNDKKHVFDTEDEDD